MKKIVLIIQICVLFTLYSYSQLNVNTNIVVNNTCNSSCNGAITANAYGGTEPYTYQWSTNPVITTPDATGLCSGSYTVTITDNASQTATASVNLTQSPLMTASIEIDSNECEFGSNNRTLCAHVDGGAAPYDYYWNNGIYNNSACISALSSVGYTVTVTDNNNCTATAVSRIKNVTNPMKIDNEFYTNISSAFSSDGSISIIASGGTPPLEYSINGGNSYQSSNIFNNLPAGIYNVIVKDDINCTITSNNIILGGALKGYVYFDADSNGIKDNGEIGLYNQKLLLLPDSVYTFTDKNGNYYFSVDSGDYKVELILKDGFSITTDTTIYDVYSNSEIIDTLNYGIVYDNENNLSINISPSGFRCNSIGYLYLTYSNSGILPSNGQIEIKKDSLIDFYINQNCCQIYRYSWLANGYVSDCIIPDSISPDSSSIFLDYSLIPGEAKTMNIPFKSPDFTAMGDTVTIYANIISQQQIITSDTAKQIITCSYDPNDKAVYPEGVYDEKFVLMNEPLSYTIRFQNTGNDTAYQVIIIDTLCHNLDLNTFEVLASSHNLQTSYTKDGIVEFRFDSIMLVDSTTNEPLSNGFVKYRIKAKSGLEDNTVVNNTAYIYFDYNPPVVTNTTMTTLTYNITKLSVDEYVKQTAKVKFYPNPFNQTAKLEFENRNNETYQLQITDITGKLLQTQQSKVNVMVIEKGKMQSGMYFYKLQNLNTKESFNGKFVIE